ncbi:Mitochondrial carrier 2 [Clonorchis sinensis]|uniref:Mitochondrial carrier 2 n=1 Tax=Clonorchis sinensis TaxID=79923 RepID=A0A3R7D6U6_CLOSI|nr:Mitochondrial carrier 2 [Clonorchis sinensis]
MLFRFFFSTMSDHMLRPSKLPERSDVISLEMYLLRQLINPFRLSWTLIKLGYEPLAPIRFYSPLAMLGWTTPIYVYPNIFQYVYHTFRTFGIWKIISTGVFASASIDFISEIFHRAFIRRSVVWETWLGSPKSVASYSDASSLEDTSELHLTTQQRHSAFRVEDQMEESEWRVFLHMLTEAMSLKAWEVLLTQPFLVVMVRQVASLIGGETQYSWFPVAVRSVYRETGFSGFFQGIIPRLFGELIGTVVYYTTCRLIRRWIFGIQRKRSTSLCMSEVLVYLGLRGYVYPFELTGCIMTLRGANLLAANEANLFSSWRPLRSYLIASGQANRGWFPICRSHVQSKHIPT